MKQFKHGFDCPVCGGNRDMPQHRGIRCWGYMSNDEQYVICTREEKAGTLQPYKNSSGYLHRLTGDCLCGTVHGERVQGPIKDAPTRKARYQRVDNERRVAEYPYCTPDGSVIALKVRFEGTLDGQRVKRFTWQRPNGEWGLGGTAPLLYGVERIAGLPRSIPIWLVEGEKAVEAMVREGWEYTVSSPHGAPGDDQDPGKKWDERFDPFLAGHPLILIPDNDPQGITFFSWLADRFLDRCPSVRVVRLPYILAHGDVVDYIGVKKYLEEPLDLDVLASTTPIWLSAEDRLFLSVRIPTQESA